MSVSLTRKIISAVTPRSLEKWEKPLGFRRRAEIQMIQHTKHLFGLMNFVNISSKKETSELIQPLEEKIIRIQEDPEVNFPLELARVIKETQSSLLKEQTNLENLLKLRRKNQEQINSQTDAILQAPLEEKVIKIRGNLPALKTLLFTAGELTEMIETGCNRMQAHFDLLKAIKDTKLSDVSPLLEKGRELTWQLFEEASKLKEGLTRIQGIANHETLGLFSLIEDEEGGIKKPHLSPAISRKVASNIRIMLIDDESDVLQNTKKYLGGFGYTVTAFDHPQQALEDFELMPQKPDLVLTDFNMPEISGSDLIERMGKVAGAESVRYAIYTAGGLKEIRREKREILEKQNVCLIGKVNSSLFANEINIIAAQINRTNPKPATASKPDPGRESPVDTPFLEFIKCVVHGVGNSAAKISMPADFFLMGFSNDPEELTAVRGNYDLCKSEVKALRAFADSAPMLLEKDKAADTLLPAKGSSDFLVGEFDGKKLTVGKLCDAIQVDFPDFTTKTIEDLNNFKEKIEGKALLAKLDEKVSQKSISLNTKDQNFVDKTRNLSEATSWDKRKLLEILYPQTSPKNPAKLLDEKKMEPIWKDTPAEARFKFAIMTSLYLEQSLADYLSVVEGTFPLLPQINLENLKKIKEATAAFSERNTAAELEGGKLADKYLIYYNLLK